MGNDELRRILELYKQMQGFSKQSSQSPMPTNPADIEREFWAIPKEDRGRLLNLYRQNMPVQEQIPRGMDLGKMAARMSPWLLLLQSTPANVGEDELMKELLKEKK